MAWTTLVAGTTITASWANQSVRDQGVSLFATTASRDSTISAPTEGLVAFETTNNTVTMYQSATTGWSPIWNLPWGIVAQTTNTASGSANAGATGLLSAPTFTAVANRRYKITCFGYAMTLVGTGTATIDVRRNGTTIASTWVNSVAGIYSCPTVVCMDVPGAGAMSYVFFTVTAGTSIQANAGTSTNIGIIVEDIGPTGAPA
jgi:hypothetical protein